MAYQTTWLLPGRVIHVQYFGRLTADELQAQSDTTKAMVNAGSAPVHIIVDTLNMTRLDVSLGDMRAIIGQKADNIGWTLIVRHNDFVQFFATVVMKMAQARYAFMDSMDDAAAFLRDHDDSLRHVTLLPEPHARQG